VYKHTFTAFKTWLLMQANTSQTFMKKLMSYQLCLINSYDALYLQV
jgi:hypothetical protein